MNVNQIVNMVVRMVVRRLMRGGVNAGMDAVGKRMSRGKPAGEQPPAPSSNETQKRIGQSMRIARKMGRM